MKRQVTLLLSILIIAAFVLGACNLPKAPTEDELAATTVAETAQAVFTRAAETAAAASPTTSPTAEATVTSIPTNTLFPTQGPTATKTPVPCNRATFVKDVTIPDNSAVAPGATFTKTWRLQNSGSCAWDSGYVLLFDSGEQMGAPATSAITSGSIAPGETLDISVELTAPTTPGTYQANFKLRSPNNIVFGINGDGQGPFWVKIAVSTPSATPTATKIPFHTSGSIDLASSNLLDLDEGLVNPANGADYWYHAVTAVEQYIEPQNGANFVLWGSSAPSQTQCQGASLAASQIKLENALVGQYLCYKTNLGRYGYFKITAYDGSNLTTDYLTWETP